MVIKNNSDNKQSDNNSKVKKNAKKAKSKSKTVKVLNIDDKPSETKIKKKNRNFDGDLESYLISWKSRHNKNSDWKFNKVLQIWAFENCLDDKKISNKLFEKLCPYIQSAMGNARVRLIEKCERVASKEINNSENNNELKETEEENIEQLNLDRAIKIISLLN